MLLKSAAALIASASVSFTVGNVVKTTVMRLPTQTLYVKVLSGIGAFVISSMAADMAEEWTSNKCDKLIASLSKLSEKDGFNANT